MNSHALQNRAAELRQALTADPLTDWAYHELMELLFVHGKRAEAEALARIALRINPCNAQAHQLRR